MEESLVRIDKMLDVLYDKVGNVKDGSEEFERIFGAIEKLENARKEAVKAMSEMEEAAKRQKFDWVDVGIKIGGWILVPTVAMILQTKINVELFEYEKNDVMTHRGFDNNLFRMMNIFKK